MAAIDPCPLRRCALAALGRALPGAEDVASAGQAFPHDMQESGVVGVGHCGGPTASLSRSICHHSHILCLSLALSLSVALSLSLSLSHTHTHTHTHLSYHGDDPGPPRGGGTRREANERHGPNPKSSTGTRHGSQALLVVAVGARKERMTDAGR